MFIWSPERPKGLFMGQATHSVNNIIKGSRQFFCSGRTTKRFNTPNHFENIFFFIKEKKNTRFLFKHYGRYPEFSGSIT